DVPLWAVNALLNVPIFIAAWRIKGFKYISKTLLATALLSPALFLTSLIPLRTGDILLNAVFGGAVSGFGLGLVFRAGATTGGTDLLASVIRHYKKHIPVSRILLILDFIVILTGFIMLGAEKSLYAVISVFTASKVVSAVLEGFSFAKAAYIISDKSDEIGQRLLTEMERGVTMLNGKGLYTGNEKSVLLCVVSSKEVIKLKEITEDADKHAFVIVSDVREVLGEGFLMDS
ncbi:MAG: YitT family protein, partial [Clostridiales bacterium]|nr:YitT family protein [Clostridiales bacterium]